MSMISVLRPRRFSHLIAADAMNVGRDPTLMFAALLSVLPCILLWFGRDALDQYALQLLGLSTVSLYTLPFVLTLPAFMIGWVTGFLFLEDRDDGPLLAHDVSPVGKEGFMLYRLVATMVLTAAITLLACRLLIPQAGWIMALVYAVLVALEAVGGALVLPAIARNKVEGLALSKLTNIASIVPLLTLIPSPLRYLGGIIPTYWIGELLGLSATDRLSLPILLVLAFVVHVGVALLLFRLIARRAG